MERQNSGYQRLIFNVDAHQNTHHCLPDKLQLTWYFGDFLISPDSRCELLVRLKRFNRYANPSGFDYEKLMFLKGINARGTIKQAQCKSSIKHGLRANLIDRFEHEYKALENFGLMLALTYGERGELSQQQWNTFKLTGTANLIAISGLHISVISVLAFLYWLN